MRLNVELKGPYDMSISGGLAGLMMVPQQSLLSTGLTIPIGQTVVLGSAAATGEERKAVILTVRPEVLLPPRERE